MPKEKGAARAAPFMRFPDLVKPVSQRSLPVLLAHFLLRSLVYFVKGLIGFRLGRSQLFPALRWKESSFRPISVPRRPLSD